MLIECSWRLETSLPISRGLGFRAHDISLRLLAFRLLLPWVLLLVSLGYVSRVHGQQCVRYSNLLILELCV